MTNEEAIEYLNLADTTVGKKIKTRTAEAIEMAIKALEQEPCEDAISRQAVITMLNKIENAVEDGDGFQFNEWIEYAKNIPSAEKTAKWIWKEGRMGIDYCHCSKCGGGQWEMEFPYCPNCGAKMEEEV